MKPPSHPATDADHWPLRIVTAAAIFDGHDAAINIIRRLLQDRGAEVIHLGHNRSVDDIVQTALQEDADAIAVSSYQGGHNEFFHFLLHQLNVHHADSIQVFGGGGGTISHQESCQLQKAGVIKIYSSDDGRSMGLNGMADDLIKRCFSRREKKTPPSVVTPKSLSHYDLAQIISWLERQQQTNPECHPTACKVVGITGTGGSGKSTLIDELLQHLLKYTEFKAKPYKIALLAIDPSRQKTGGALLGDRIRINAQPHPRLYIRSMATRQANVSVNPALPAIIQLLKQQEFNLILVETAGIGQSDASITHIVDETIYVMTRDYGAPSQLEKIEMLDCADFVVLNKYEQQGSEDALREIKKQWCRNHLKFDHSQPVPVYPMVASRFDDHGLNFFMAEFAKQLDLTTIPTLSPPQNLTPSPLIPTQRIQYLAEISRLGQHTKHQIQHQKCSAKKCQSFYITLQAFHDPDLPELCQPYTPEQLEENQPNAQLRQAYNQHLSLLTAETMTQLQSWLGQSCDPKPHFESISHLNIPLIAKPQDTSWETLVDFLLNENLPGQFPYTAGVFPYRHDTETPTRMFAGEGTPEDTNRRFFYLRNDQRSIRLSTAFDPITLYGKDPDSQPDIYGCIGMSGVSISNLDDMKKCYSGIDLNDPHTSVSMTINGPAPIAMAWLLNTAIDQRIEKYLRTLGNWQQAKKTIQHCFKDQAQPTYHGPLPPNHDGLGLGLLGISGNQLVNTETYEKIASDTRKVIRGTLQADILKEEIAQNECLFSLDFGLRLMADIQHYFIQHQINHFYGVSVSGYHIAEAGANPITQLALTLANGFTLIEYYLAQGMSINNFASQFSFFFSNGMDPEYAVIGRVARRIWARALRDYYQANEKSQKLKYHIQTSGRSLHAQDINFNDIRTTIQAQYAINDNCNSLHTNAYDEAVTTPTEESVRRALAIQLILQNEAGLNKNQNPLQGAYIINDLTHQVEAAVYQEFERLSKRGGVLGALETHYQRAKIQDESMYYEQCKQNGTLPITGVNTFINPASTLSPAAHLVRCSEPQKQHQIQSIQQFKYYHRHTMQSSLNRLNQAIQKGENSFEAIMDAVQDCSLEQMTSALKNSGGQFRRKM